MTVRVIRGDGARPTPAVTSAGFAETARKMSAARYDARLEGERLIAEARRQADQIVQAANEQSAAITERARLEGVAAGRIEAFAIVAKARIEESLLVDRASDVVVTASRAVAERAVGRVLSIDDEALAGWVREALAPLKGARRIVVRGHPANLTRLQQRLREIAPTGCDSIELVTDHTFALDALHARSDLGEVRLEVRVQVDALISVLSDALAATVRGRHE